MKNKKSDNTIDFKTKNSRDNTLFWGYVTKIFILTIWSIPWTIILGFSLNFSSLFWGMIEYYSAVVLVFSLTNKDYGFLPLTYIITGIYFAYTLPERQITSTYIGYNKAIAWSIINIAFAIFIILYKPLKAYKKYNKKIDKKNISDNFSKDLLKRLGICTCILSAFCIVLLIPAYIMASPQPISSNQEIVFINKGFEDVIRKELSIDNEKTLKCSDLDSIVAISIKDNRHITIGKDYSYSTEHWTDNVILDFSDLIKFDGIDYDLEIPITNIKDLRFFNNLKYINIQSDHKLIIYNLDDLRTLKSLETLVVKTSTYNKTSHTNISALKHMKQLKCLILDTDNLTNLKYLSELNNLNTLRIINDGSVDDISVISSLPKLEYLCLSGCNITDPSPLETLNKLKYLSLYKNNITDITSLNKFTDLIYLDLRSNNINDISPISSLTHLKYAALLGNENITDISPLNNLSELKYLWLEDTDKYNLSVLNNNTELEIYTGQ